MEGRQVGRREEAREFGREGQESGGREGQRMEGKGRKRVILLTNRSTNRQGAVTATSGSISAPTSYTAGVQYVVEGLRSLHSRIISRREAFPAQHQSVTSHLNTTRLSDPSLLRRHLVQKS